MIFSRMNRAKMFLTLSKIPQVGKQNRSDMRIAF